MDDNELFSVTDEVMNDAFTFEHLKETMDTMTKTYYTDSRTWHYIPASSRGVKMEMELGLPENLKTPAFRQLKKCEKCNSYYFSEECPNHLFGKVRVPIEIQPAKPLFKITTVTT